MKTINHLLSDIHSLGIKLWVEDGRLRYNAPKDRMTSTLRAEIGERKAEILAFLQQDNITRPKLIQPVSHDIDLPLSFAQQRLWFLEQLEGASAAYNMPAALRLAGKLDIVALNAAVQEVVNRHEVLRTNFVVKNDVAVQVIAPSLNIPLAVVDLQLLPAHKQSAVVKELAQEEFLRPFDIVAEPLLRVRLLQLSENEYVLLLVIHHIISDGWSMGVLIQELTYLYDAFSKGLPSPLPELPIQYADFAVWQRQWLQEVGVQGIAPLQTQLNYWQQKLAGAPAILELPADRPHVRQQTFRGGAKHFELNAKLAQKLKLLSQKVGATLFMTLFGAFVTLLSRYSGLEDIVVGSPIANRNRRETESLIGFFVNTLVLRTDLSGNPSFLELLKRVRSSTLDAFTHQDIPFEKLVEEMQPERHLNRNPLVQVLFALQNTPMHSLNLSELSWNVFKLDIETSRFDLEINLWEAEAEIHGYFSYNIDLFDASTVERMAGHFLTLLEAIVENPQQRICELPLLTQGEKHQLLPLYISHPSPSQCIHELFERQVKETPDAVAVVFAGELLTYHELNTRANQLAHYLRRLGVTTEVPVGICMERSIDLVVGLLGIMKANGAYVPLDPNYPFERLSFMLEDIQPPVLLTQEKLLDELPSHWGQVVCIDTDWQLIGQEREENLVNYATGENLAYVIYTSGSTGKPKGVLVPHKGLLNLVSWHREAFEVTASDRATLLAGTAFDASVWELWVYLIAGASIYPVKSDIVTSPVDLQNFLISNQITVSFLPTPLAETILSLAWSDDVALRIMLTGGDKLYQYPSTSLPFKLFNNYGPTENTVVTTSGLITPNGDENASPTIGRAITNTQVYILDRHLQPLPIGIPGELYIGGASLAQGYLNRPDLTAEKFIPNLFSQEPGMRLYKTGDLARFRVDGSIEYIGRIDNQVKIRGFRIELGEIEAVLAQHPAVTQTVVIAREDKPGNKRLISYVVPNCEGEKLVPQLRQFLSAKLPDNMVPSESILLDTLPLTPNGKVDRAALPAPSEVKSERYFIAPRNWIERQLADIWGEVLGLPQVGIEDNFFELGGHSLLATQVLSRLRKVFHVELPLRSLFESPTIAQLSERIAVRENQQLPPIPSIPRDGELPLSFAQQRLWVIDRLEGATATYNIPAAVRLTGNLNVNALEMTVREIVRRHEALRTNFVMVNGSPLQAIATSLEIEVPIIDLQNLSEVEQTTAVQKLVSQEAEKPFDLGNGALLRLTLLRLEPESHVLILVMHHIVSDGWSMGVFIREFSLLYQTFGDGHPSSLPELQIQYADFAAWQGQWLQGDVLETQINYWHQQLAGAPPMLELLTDRPRPPRQTFQGKTIDFSVNPELTQQLLILSQESGTTLFMTLLAAFANLLSRYSNQEDIVIGSPIANRDRSEIEPLIGFFVNTLALRIDLEANPSFLELLTRVRTSALEAYAHQEVPFEQVIEALQPERNLSHSPLFQVMFALQNAPTETLELPGLNLTPLKIENVTAKFDINLLITEVPEGLVGTWEYNSDLFDTSTINRMVEHFQNLLAAIVVNPQQRLLELPLLSEVEQYQLLKQLNNTQAEFPVSKCIHQLFEEQVERTPENIAVVFEGQQLTYRELNCRANQLAHHLQSKGVLKEVLVGICIERSLSMIVGVLAILKAGGAYVPIDPLYPQERLAYMLSNSQVPILLTQQKLMNDLPEYQGHIVCLDAIWEEISHYSEENPISNVTTDNLAYVIYTSGSTGQPKGVLIEHRNVVRLFAATQSWYKFHQNDTWTLFHSFAFDFSVWEIWGALLYGGKLIVVPYWVSRSPEAFYELIIHENVTVLNQTPSAFRQLIQAEQSITVDRSRNTSLRLVIFGGEALDIQSLKPWFDKHGDKSPQLINMYGITETTVHVTYRPIAIADLNSNASIIGTAIPDLQVYILDKHLQPSPIGVRGEMYIGGASLARGYLNRPELTAEKFIPNPFTNKQGEQLYKTGDLARYLTDGSIEYLGRIDHQVKIRGFRIELGEIEAILSQHPQVQETVVIVHEEASNKRLVAYVVPNQQKPTTSELYSFLQNQLPNYMIPGAFVLLDSLPLTSNGKVNRKALTAPDIATNYMEEYVAPRTPIEEVLATIWMEVLGLPRVSIYSNFFAIGGDSIRTIQVVHEASKYNLPVVAKDIFEHQTIYKLAQHISNSQYNPSTKLAPPLHLLKLPDDVMEKLPHDIEEAYPMAKMQEFMVHHYSNDHQNMGVYHCQQSFDIYDDNPSLDALKYALEIIVQKHPAFRTVFIVKDLKQPLQVVKKNLQFTIDEQNICELMPEKQEAYIDAAFKQDRQNLFNVDNINEPLFRFRIFQKSQNNFELMISTHHGIEDGWGNVEFLKELFDFYLALKRGNKIAIDTPVNKVYKEFVALEKEIINSQPTSEFWKKYLGEYTYKPLEEIKVFPDYSDDELETFAEYTLDSEITSKLQKIYRELKVSPKAVFLSAYLDLISSETKKNAVAIGIITNGRTERLSDPFKTLGLFWNMAPFYQLVIENKSLQTQKIQQNLIDIEPYVRYPLSQILADRKETELFFATFNFLHFHNTKDYFAGKNLQLKGKRFHDKFNFPLNYAVSIDPLQGDVRIRVEYDKLYFTYQHIRSMMKSYIDILRQAVK